MISRDTALGKYREAKMKGEVDRDIIPILDILNSSEEYYTTSSCSGRIVVMQIPRIGDKKNAKFLGKWHQNVSSGEVLNTISSYSEGYLFLLVQSAIIHVVARDLKSAKRLIRIALESGFKYTTIKNIEKNGILVEILSTENLHIPLGENGKLKVSQESIEFFVKMANHTLRRVKNKLSKFEGKINCSLRASS